MANVQVPFFASASATGEAGVTNPPRSGPVELANSEFVETRSVTLEWKVTNLKVLFESSKGDTKSKCVKSALFDNHRWQIFLYPNSGHEQFLSLYLSCEPTASERERGLAERAGWTSSSTTSSPPPELNAAASGSLGRQSGTTLSKDTKGPWRREGKFKFTFEARTVDRRMTFKQMEANDHSFSDSARNWGYANFWKRSDAYYNNPQVRLADAFLIVCTIVYSPTPPSPPPLPRLLIPKDLVAAYAALFDDPDYSDVVFRIRPTSRPEVRERRLYAAKKVLAGRCEYFETMFSSGFNESTLARVLPMTNPSPHSKARKFSELDDEDEVDFSESDPSDDEDDWDEDDDSDVDESPEEEEEENSSTTGARQTTTQNDLSGSLSHRSGDSTNNPFVHQATRMDREASSSSATPAVTRAKSDQSSRPSSAAVSDDEDDAAQRESDDRQRALSDSDEGEGGAGRRTPDRGIRASRDGEPLPFVDAPTAPDSPVKPTVPLTNKKNRSNNKTKLKRNRESVDSRPRFEVIVTDAAYNSYRALLHYLYTDSIAFAPLASTYHVARDAALSTNTPFPFTSRRAYLLANTPWPTSKDGVGPCSAKAIYRLADKLSLPELKERAYEHIVKSLTVQNIPYEVFGSFAARFDEVKRVEIAFLLERWNEIKASHGLRKVFAFIRTNKFPGFEEVWLRIIDHLEVKTNPGVEGEERG